MDCSIPGFLHYLHTGKIALNCFVYTEVPSRWEKWMIPTSMWTPDQAEPEGWWCWLLLISPPTHQRNLSTGLIEVQCIHIISTRQADLLNSQYVYVSMIRRFLFFLFYHTMHMWVLRSPCMHVYVVSYVWLFVTPMDCSSPGSSVQRIFPGKNTEVGCHSLLLGIFLTQGSNPGLPHCRWILYHLRHQGSPRILEWVTIPFSKGSSQPRDQTHVSCVFSTGRILYHWTTWESPLVSQPGIKPMSPTLKMQS